jgi:hypothetical protein
MARLIPSRAAREEPARTGPAAEPLALWREVLRARRAVTRQRHLPVRGSFAIARGDLLSALEAYVASLVDHGRPVPYALRDELRLQRLTCSADRYLRYGADEARRS